MKNAGPLILDVQGEALTAEEKELIEHPMVSGVIFFSRNYSSPQQLSALVQSLRSIKPLLLMVDQEGGRVQRFKNSFTLLPKAADYGKKFDENPAQGLAYTTQSAFQMASELLTQGIDLSLAPVLDVNYERSSVIGDRSFHQNINKLIQLAQAFVEGMKQAGMAACGKHFPGHGYVIPDSHLELPTDSRPWQEIANNDLKSFIYFIENKIPSLMTAHIVFSEVDSLPVTFSKKWLRTILREQLKYEGVIMSDDLTMKGADVMGGFGERFAKAIDAGCDLAFVCNNRQAVIEVLDECSRVPSSFTMEKFKSLQGNFELAAHSLAINEVSR